MEGQNQRTAFSTLSNRLLQNFQGSLRAENEVFGAHPIMAALARLLGARTSANPNDFQAFSALPSAARKSNFPSGMGLIFVVQQVAITDRGEGVNVDT